jgi:hypothetical protein
MKNILSPLLKILTALIIIFGSFESLRFQICHHDTIEFTQSVSSHPLFQEKLTEEEIRKDMTDLLSEVNFFNIANDHSFKRQYFYFENYYLKSSQRFNFISHLPPPFSVKFLSV